MERVYAIAAAVGATLKERCGLEGLSYDGETIATHMKGVALQEGEILHEICHYIAATPAERLLPEFGMVARPGVRLGSVKPVGGEWDEYQRKVPTPIVDRPQRKIRELATQYLHYEVAIVLEMCPAVPSTPWEIWTRVAKADWDVKGTEWLRSQGHDPEELVSRMIRVAQYPCRIAA